MIPFAANAITPGRTTSLRGRWNRAFAMLTVVLLLVGAASFVGTGLVARTFRDAAEGLERGATIRAKLRADIVGYATTVTGSAPASQRRTANEFRLDVRDGYAKALANEDDPRARQLIRASHTKWQELMADPIMTGRLYVDRRQLAGQQMLAASLAKLTSANALLDQAGSASRAAVRAELAGATDRERLRMLGLVGLGLFSLVLVVRLARRLSVEVLRPVGILRGSANRLAAGQLDHRVMVDRTDEFGELAVAFNAMADAIAGSQRRLTLEANTDSLTGLANRAAFMSRLEATLTRPERRSGHQAVLFVDIDDFKDVNDSFGHAAGDQLLRAVAERLNAAVRPSDLVCRLGGDEFALLLDGLHPGLALIVAQRVVAALAEPVEIGAARAHVSASAGLAVRRDDSTPEALIREADVAMYAAKAKGKHRVEQYDAGLDDVTVDRQSLKSDLDGAVERGELVLDYQPVVHLETGMLVGLEALVRWQHPTRGLLPPLAFIDLAEETGAIRGIGVWVLESAARQLRNWQRRYGLPNLWMSVNVSVSQLDGAGFADEVTNVLDATGLDPPSLVLEVTESVLANPTGNAAATLAAVRLPGVRVALDDFGSGYSSIGYLRQLPVDILKIDRSFVSGTCAGDTDGELLEAIVALGQRLGLDVIPEGIEEVDQLSRLQAMGCHFGQGFLLARPVSADAIEVLLASPVPLPVIGLAPSAPGNRAGGSQQGANASSPRRSPRPILLS